MSGRSNILIFALGCALIAGLSGCGVVRTMTGTNLDAERFARAREAKTLEIRMNESIALAERLQRSNPAADGDVTVQVSPQLLNTVAQWYRGRTGWLDESTRYTVDSLHVTLHHGCAIAAIALSASQESWEVDLRLGMDCLIRFGKNGGDLEMTIEPYNITPVVESTGYLIGTSSMIENMVKSKLGRLTEDFPPLRLPLEFGDSVPVENQMFSVRDRINLDISVPRRVVDYRLAISDVLVLEEGLFIILDQSKITVR